MYYIKDKKHLNSGVIGDYYDYHIISSLNVDYIGRTISVILASYKSLEDFARNYLNKDSTIQVVLNQYTVSYETYSFDIDPVLFAFRILVQDDGLFHKSEIRRLYNEESFLKGLISQDIDYSKLSIDFTMPTGEYSNYVETDWDNELKGEFVISDVNINNVIDNSSLI
jgi:hypothetical protein|nr:MAG TPA: hypothetical protein [Caudoviricetes sp.]